MGIGESHSLVGDAIDVRRVDRRIGGIGADVAQAHIVRQDVNNVGSGGVCTTGKRDAQPDEREQKNAPAHEAAQTLTELAWAHAANPSD